MINRGNCFTVKIQPGCLLKFNPYFHLRFVSWPELVRPCLFGWDRLNARHLDSTVYENKESKFQGLFVWESIKNLLLEERSETSTISFLGRVLVFLVLLAWGLKFVFVSPSSNYPVQSFWHLVNIPFHEAGHLVFSPFGRLLHSLGGSLGQLLMPFICLVTFLFRARDTFAASFCLWWLGENFIDLAPYINDARSLSLPLIGGNTGATAPYGFHDWEFILRETGLIRYDHLLAGITHRIGSLFIVLSLVWSGYLLYKEWKGHRPD